MEKLYHVSVIPTQLLVGVSKPNKKSTTILKSKSAKLLKRQDCPWNFKATPNLHSHYLASPPELRCRTPNLRRYRPLSHRKFSKILYPSHYLAPTTESFLPLSSPNVARRFSSLFYYLFSVFFTNYLYAVFFPTWNYKGLSFLWWWIWHHNLTLQGSIFYNQISEHVMLQDLYDDGVGFADLLWGEIWVFLFREERGVWWGLVLWVSGLLAIIVYHCVYFVHFITV